MHLNKMGHKSQSFTCLETKDKVCAEGESGGGRSNSFFHP
jgi:hypothetical protein